MAILRLKELRYSNIASVGAEPVHITLDTHARTLITGTNGAGKSTMIEALFYGLFGKPYRAGVTKGELINRTNKKNLSVEIWFDYDNHSYYVKRGQKKEIFVVERDGQPLDEAASIKDFQAHFESIINMTPTSFKQIVVLGTSGYVPFMELPAGGRRSLVEDLLGLSIISEIDKLNKGYIRELNQNIQMSEMKSEHLTQQIETHRRYAAEAARASQENIAQYQAMYDEQVAAAHKAKAREAELLEKLAQIVLPEDMTPTLTKINNAIVQTRAQIQGFDRVIELHSRGGKCPTCAQEIQCGNDAEVQAQKAHALKKIELIEAKRVDIDKRQALYLDKQREVQAIRQEAAEVRRELERAVAQAKQIKARIESLMQERVDNSEETAKLEAELREVAVNKASLVTEKYHRGFITEIMKDSGFKAVMVKRYVPYLNARVRHYLQVMGAEYTFKLDEQFKETIKTHGSESASYGTFSQGEKARINLALLFAWRDVSAKLSGTRVSLLILDEVFDSATDQAGIDALRKILDSLQDNVYIISHREHDSSDFDRHVKMQKKGRFTTAEVLC